MDKQVGNTTYWLCYNMVSQITHIVLTEKVFDHLFSKFDHRAFILGTSLPDIRYFSNAATRSETHYDPADLPMVLNEPDSFRAGIIFHSVVDLTRVSFLEKNEVYKKYATTDASKSFLKYLEDQILYDKISDWQKIIDYFNDLISAEENHENINREHLLGWHKLLQGYLKQKPNPAIRKPLAKIIGFPDEYIIEGDIKISEFEQQPELIKIINNFYDNFEKMILS